MIVAMGRKVNAVDGGSSTLGDLPDFLRCGRPPVGVSRPLALCCGLLLEDRAHMPYSMRGPPFFSLPASLYRREKESLPLTPHVQPHQLTHVSTQGQ